MRERALLPARPKGKGLKGVSKGPASPTDPYAHLTVLNQSPRRGARGGARKPQEVRTVVPGRWNSPDGSPDSTKKPRSGWPQRLLLAFLCSALLSVFTPSPALSQAVRGRVIDDRSSDGIEGVAITLFRYGRKGRTVSSDSTGEFFLPLPGRGPFSLEAGRIGYATSRSRQFIAELTDTITVEFRLDVEAILLDPLVVTAVGSPGTGPAWVPVPGCCSDQPLGRHDPRHAGR
jgi:hypothetical protein